MKIKEIREKSIGELDTLLKDNQAKLCQLRFDASARQVKNYKDINNIKKDIARILTVKNSTK